MQWSEYTLSDAVVLFYILFEAINSGEHSMCKIDIIVARNVHNEHIHQVVHLVFDRIVVLVLDICAIYGYVPKVALEV